MFRSLDARGTIFDSNAYLGRSNLVLLFFRDYMCATCRHELKELRDNYDRITYQDGEVVAISTNNIDEIKHLAVDMDLPFILISDPAHVIIDDYGVFDRNAGTAFITLFIIDKTGIVRFAKRIEGMADEVTAGDIINKLRMLNTSH